MSILAMRTDQPDAELYLLKDDSSILCSLQWRAHRELSDTLFTKIDELLEQAGLNVSDLSRVVVFRGPGSFTGLRIGVTVANTLGYALGIPVVGATGEDWLTTAHSTPEDLIVTPLYGEPARITKPRK